MNRWDKPRLGIVVVLDIVMLLAIQRFRYYTGQTLIWLGLHGGKHLMTPEQGHNTMIKVLNWTYWEPQIGRF